MKFFHYTLLVALTLCFVTLSYAQPKSYDLKNGISIAGGLTQYDIITDNFNTKKGNGWTGGLAASLILPHKWYGVSYGMQLAENNFSIEARKPTSEDITEEIDYKLLTVQVAFLLHIKLIKSNVTLDIGPMLQYNSDSELKNKQEEEYLINNFETLTAKDITALSRLNFNGAVGLSAGFGAFRLKGQYVYGFTNILNKLNKESFNDLEPTKFKGNQSMALITAMFTF